jgi:hypothetical protein
MTSDAKLWFLASTQTATPSSGTAACEARAPTWEASAVGEDTTREARDEQAFTKWILGVLDRIDTRFPRVGRVIVDPARAIAGRYERDELPTHAGALTYGAFLSLRCCCSRRPSPASGSAMSRSRSRSSTPSST